MPSGHSTFPARILVLGDSVAWGQGLRHFQKMHNVLAKQIYRTAGFVPYVAQYAHSGGIIGAGLPRARQQPWWPREIPSPHDTLFEQCDVAHDFEIDNRFDLIIVCAGINDVDVTRIFNPLTTPQAISDRTLTYCYTELLQALIYIGRRFFPQNSSARVFVLTYYPILSQSSQLPDPVKVATIFAKEAISPPPLPSPTGPVNVGYSFRSQPSLRDVLIENSLTFWRQVIERHSDAVASANEHFPNRFTLIDPGISEKQSAFTEHPLIWGLDPQTEKPTDPLVADRIRYCDAELKSEMQSPIAGFVCRRASVGHPNVAGAAQYANVMLATLQRLHAPDTSAS